ncbi:MAG: phage integrase N-terminal SAM-like domain-containing protein, partial [Gammaproteobacteria bacterium]
MKASEQTRFDKLYKCHLRALKLQGLSDSTIDVYSRAVRRVSDHFDCCPDQLTTDQLETYFAELVESHSWSTVKVFCYTGGTTGETRYRTLRGEDFLWLVLQHV